MIDKRKPSEREQAHLAKLQALPEGSRRASHGDDVAATAARIERLQALEAKALTIESAWDKERAKHLNARAAKETALRAAAVESRKPKDKP